MGEINIWILKDAKNCGPLRVPMLIPL